MRQKNRGLQQNRWLLPAGPELECREKTGIQRQERVLYLTNLKDMHATNPY